MALFSFYQAKRGEKQANVSVPGQSKKSEEDGVEKKPLGEIGTIVA